MSNLLFVAWNLNRHMGLVFFDAPQYIQSPSKSVRDSSNGSLVSKIHFRVYLVKLNLHFLSNSRPPINPACHNFLEARRICGKDFVLCHTSSNNESRVRNKYKYSHRAEALVVRNRVQTCYAFKHASASAWSISSATARDYIYLS